MDQWTLKLFTISDPIFSWFNSSRKKKLGEGVPFSFETLTNTKQDTGWREIFKDIYFVRNKPSQLAFVQICLLSGEQRNCVLVSGN